MAGEDAVPEPRRDRLDQIEDPHARDLRDIDLAAAHHLGASNRERHPLLEADPESGHAGVGHRDGARRTLGGEKWDHAATAADDVAVAHRAEYAAPTVAVGVTLDEELLGTQLRRAVEIDGVRCLVGTERKYALDLAVDRGTQAGDGQSLVGADHDHAPDALVDGRVDDVLGADHVGLNRFERIVLAGWNLLERGRVEHDVHAVHRPLEPWLVPHVADEESQRGVVEARDHLGLLQLVAAEHDQPPRTILAEHDLHELVAERTGAPGDQHRRLAPVHRPVTADCAHSLSPCRLVVVISDLPAPRPRRTGDGRAGRKSRLLRGARRGGQRPPPCRGSRRRFCPRA